MKAVNHISTKLLFENRRLFGENVDPEQDWQIRYEYGYCHVMLYYDVSDYISFEELDTIVKRLPAIKFDNAKFSLSVDRNNTKDRTIIAQGTMNEGYNDPIRLRDIGHDIEDQLREIFDQYALFYAFSMAIQCAPKYPYKVKEDGCIEKMGA